MTKIDGTARGRVVLAIREELDIPKKLIGFGEKIDDIGPFHSENFARGPLGRLDLRGRIEKDKLLEEQFVFFPCAIKKPPEGGFP